MMKRDFARNVATTQTQTTTPDLTYETPPSYIKPEISNVKLLWVAVGTVGAVGAFGTEVNKSKLFFRVAW